MGKLLIFWIICMFAKAMENRNHPKFVRGFEEYERSDPTPQEVQRGYVNFRPSSLAAPQSRRDKMENPGWANPCDYANGPVIYRTSSMSFKKFEPEDAKIVANQAKSALDEAQKFKDLFACTLQSHDTFSETSDTSPWLQKFKFINKDAFPKDKNKIDKEMSKKDLSKVTNNIGIQLPTLYKALKMVVAGLYAIKENGLQDLVKERMLKPYFDVTFNRVRQVLCVLSELMLSLYIGIPSLMDDEIPSFQANRVDTMFMIYRDTLLYLDFLRQVMNHWAAERRYALDHNNHFHKYINSTTFLDYTLS